MLVRFLNVIMLQSDHPVDHQDRCFQPISVIVALHHLCLSRLPTMDVGLEAVFVDYDADDDNDDDDVDDLLVVDEWVS